MYTPEVPDFKAMSPLEFDDYITNKFDWWFDYGEGNTWRRWQPVYNGLCRLKDTYPLYYNMFAAKRQEVRGRREVM